MPKKSSELSDIKKLLKEMNTKLDRITELETSYSRIGSVPTTLELLPSHLKDTANAIAMLGKATAEEVAKKTGRTRAAESDYLNQLASRGYLKKERKGKQVNFLVFSLYTLCPQCSARVPMTLDRCSNCGASLVEPKT